MGPIKGIDHVMTTVGDAQSVGGGQTQAGEVRRATMTLVLAPRGERPSQADIETQVRRALINVPGARFSLGVGGPGEKMSLILASEDTAALKATGQALERQLRGVPGLANVTSTASLERPEIVVRPNAQRAAEQGVTTAAIGETVRIATNGDFDAQVAKLNLDNRQVPIQVRIPDAARQDMDVVANLRVHGRNGLVPLASVADIAVESGPSQIDRYDRRRYVTVNADLGGTPLGQALAEAKALPAAQAMPSSVKLIETGDAEIMMELLGGFGMAIVIGLLCVFCVLVLLFHDFFQPLTILSAVPLSLGGAFVALLLSKGMLSIPSMIGLVMLMGIVTKNSILLVEYAVVGIQERGLPLHEALIDACHKRARPIVMTTVAMIAGMLPIALGLGADASFRQPMAIAVIGGLVTSTGLSLLVVPVAFTYVDGLERRVRRFLAVARRTPARCPKTRRLPKHESRAQQRHDRSAPTRQPLPGDDARADGRAASLHRLASAAGPGPERRGLDGRHPLSVRVRRDDSLRDGGALFIRPTELADRIHWLGALLMGLFSSLLVLTLLRDVALWLMPAAWRHDSAVVIVALAGLVTLVGYINARRIPRVAHVAVPIAGLPAPLHGFTIAQITDLHVGPTIKQAYVAGVVNRLNALQPDLIAMTGDLVDGDVEGLRPHVGPLAGMRARHGVFAVTGNHEYYSGVAQWVAEYERLGMRVLMNEHTVIEHDGAALVVAGVTDFSAGKFDSDQASDPVRALAGSPAGVVPTILLAHQPRSAPAAEQAGFDLQLSGHTHGGQFWPWSLFVPLQQPFTAGLHRLGRLWIYTSRGTDTGGRLSDSARRRRSLCCALSPRRNDPRAWNPESPRGFEDLRCPSLGQVCLSVRKRS